MTVGFPGLHPSAGPLLQGWARQVMRGKLNCVTEWTLAANAASTAFSDDRISAQTVCIPIPKTANAGTALQSDWYIVPGNKTATFNHANTADTDKTFLVALIG